MNLELTKKQYQTLLELVFMGNWVANAMKVGDTVATYNELEALLFSKATEFAAGDLVEGPNPSQKFLDKVFPYIDEYNVLTFWDQLAERLARRDLIRKHGASAWNMIAKDEQYEKLEETKNIYLEIFETNGINAIDLCGPLNLK